MDRRLRAAYRAGQLVEATPSEYRASSLSTARTRSDPTSLPSSHSGKATTATPTSTGPGCAAACPTDAFTGRPQIAIANTASDLTPCNAHLTEVAASVKNGIYEAGGIPLDLPVVSLGETQVRPTAMLWRNMAAMATEEMLRANPIDGVVLLGGCDKTIPSLLMAAASVDLPAVVVPGGPMLTGTFRGVPLGCGTDVWRLSEEVRAGTLSADAVHPLGVGDDPQPRALQHDGHRLDDGAGGRGARHCAARAWPGRRPRTAGCSRRRTHRPARRRAGRGRPAAQHLPDQGLVPQRDRGAGRDRRVDQRGRAPAGHRRPASGRPDLDDFDRIGSGVPLLVDLQPAGRFLMDDFHRAGGLLAVLREVRDLLDPTALTVTGRPLVDYLDDAPIWDPRSSAPLGSRWSPRAGSPCCAATSPPTAR